MKKYEIIKKNADYERIINSKHYLRNKYYSIYYNKLNTGNNLYGITASKKYFKTAVSRNKLKRQIKDIIDKNKKEFPKPIEYVIILKRDLISLNYNEMEKEILSLLNRFKEE